MYDRAYYYSPGWYALKDRVKRRAGRRCEWCRLRPMMACHHRTYSRFGHEDLQDLMGVCGACHRAIHGLMPWGAEILVTPGSLADQGDSGLEMTEEWRAYLDAHTPALQQPMARRF